MESNSETIETPHLSLSLLFLSLSLSLPKQNYIFCKEKNICKKM